MSELVSSCKILPDISKPRWDQSTYLGRAKHFFSTANPLNLGASASKLDESKKIVHNYRKGVYDKDLTVDQLWKAKSLYDSAFHPDTGEKMVLIGRMSAQVPCNMLIVGGMLTWHKRFIHVLFFQWINQSFNAFVNYTNRSGPTPVSGETLLSSYIGATTGAISIAMIANRIVSKMKRPMVGRFVPFLAVACANCINIPMMRINEFKVGIPVEDADGRILGSSDKVPLIAIPQVTLSRIGMAVPNMVLGPVIFEYITRCKWYRRPMAGPIQVVLCGFMLTFSTPLCCALFPQKGSISVSKLEKPIQDRINTMTSPPTVVFYNKGL